RIERVGAPMLLPTPALRRRVLELAGEVGASLVVMDPVFPLGLLGPSLAMPYGIVIHGAELTIPAHLPVVAGRLRRVLAQASVVVVGGSYPLGEVRRLVAGPAENAALIVPGVDCARFHPLGTADKTAARAHFGVGPDATLVASVSRLVPRKGMDVLIEAVARLAPSRPGLELVIGGSGRDEARLRRLIARTGAPARLLGVVSDEDLAALAGCCDVWAMLCRNRWLGLEQEGFGIVFLEGAAAGVAQLAGRSGGADEAVLDEVTGLVVDRPADVVRAAEHLARLLDDPPLRRRLGEAARVRALEHFDYDVVVRDLDRVLGEHGG
ncbi:MAG TPA: glycosyltransferase family 4 protein, partial [Acidimicrobiales bacterium]|nr:glycosyltransferase family 4 protein [Acidimicrobiales bacterium]